MFILAAQLLHTDILYIIFVLNSKNDFCYIFVEILINTFAAASASPLGGVKVGVMARA